MEEAVMKLVLLGDAGVGKSALVLQFVRGTFVEASESTIGAAFLSKSVEIDRATVRMEIWDTAGQEDYDRVRSLCYPGAHVFIFCFSLIK
jgi:small GTP-binding protein